MLKTAVILSLTFFAGSAVNAQRLLDVQGHRGCRGILPENTIEGFVKALELGVTTLEMDVVISQDNEVVVSHEPYFSHVISSSPDGDEISKHTEKQHNIYLLPYSEVRKYDVGMRNHPRFPKQQNIAAFKPLLSDVISSSEEYAQKHGLKKPHYNVEIKRRPEYDSIFHPPVEEFTRLVVTLVLDSGLSDRVCIQSFDLESLQWVKQLAPDLTTALLVEKGKSVEEHIEKLGFTPDIYSPYFKLVSTDMVAVCKEKGIQVIPWTVNKQGDMLEMIQFDVDGIITDYPDQLIELATELNIQIK